MKRCLSIAAVLVLFLAVAPPTRAQTQTQPVTASYAVNWNMVGGPPGTDFSAASFFYTYSSGNYSTPSNMTAAGCQGYWAYFASPTTVTLNSTATGPTQSCPLQAGWNLVGNPFAGTADLPSGVTAYYFDADAGVYKTVSKIPPGAAVWIPSDSAGTLTLQFEATTTTQPQTLTLDDLSPGPYRVRVGDYIELLLPAITPHTAQAPAAYLHLENAGETGPADCSSGSCSVSLVNQFWIWRAIAAGTASIVVSNPCTTNTQSCRPSSTGITIDITS